MQLFSVIFYIKLKRTTLIFVQQCERFYSFLVKFMHSLLFFSSKIGNVGNIDFEMDIFWGPWSKGNAEIK